MENNNNQNWQSEPPEAQQQTLVTLYTQNKFNSVVARSTELLEQFPNSIFLLNILGVVNIRLKRFDAAINNFKQVLKVNPDFVDAYLNLGSVLKSQGNLKAAIEIYKQALKIKPDFAEALYNMGNALEENGNPDEAIASYKQSINIKPGYVEAYLNMGNALWKQGDIEASIENYKQAIKYRPGLVIAYVSLLQILEKSNRINDLSLVLEKAKIQIENLPAELKYYEALVFWREKKYEDALNILDVLESAELPEGMLPAFFKLKGRCCEKVKKYDEAFKCFAQMNEHVKFSKEFQKFSPDRYFTFYTNQFNQIRASSYKIPEKIADLTDNNQQVFLVGFPRSGTTLLDTILRSHSKVCVVEEKPMLAYARQSIHVDDNLEKIENLDHREISIARRAYYDELEKYLAGPNEDRLIIDKLPLNILEIPLIHRLFPGSEIVLAIRHPLDSILSCWMQDFKLNDAMANMIDLERIVDFYCLAMNTLKVCRSRYDLNVHMIRYEDLVHDMKSELTSLLRFLRLAWEDQLENYRDTALKRGNINTPSYSQVIQPLYKDSAYRWKNYQKYLEGFFHKIQPWVNEYGYEL